MDHDVRELLSRAAKDTKKSKGPVVRAPVARKENRYVFNDSTPVPGAGDEAYAVPRNRRVVRRRISTFNIIVGLFGLGIAIVLYVNNIIHVNRLAAEIGVLQTQYNTVLNTNAALSAELNRKSAWERIGGVATGQLGLSFPTEQPSSLSIDRDLQTRLRRQ